MTVIGIAGTPSNTVDVRIFAYDANNDTNLTDDAGLLDHITSVRVENSAGTDITATAAGGRPEERAKTVSRSVGMLKATPSRHNRRSPIVRHELQPFHGGVVHAFIRLLQIAVMALHEIVHQEGNIFAPFT